MGFSTANINKLLQRFLYMIGGDVVTCDIGTYIALSTTLPTDTGGNVTEPVGNNYTRKLIIPLTDWDAPLVNESDMSVYSANTNNLAWDTATGPWGTLGWWCLYNASTGGTFCCWGKLDFPVIIVAGDIFQFNAGDLKTRIIDDTVNGKLLLSDDLRIKMLDWLLGRATTRPTQDSWYVGLSTTLPVNTPTGITITEPVGNGYARKLITGDQAVPGDRWAVPSSGTTYYTVTIEFPVATGSWGTVGWWVMAYGALPTLTVGYTGKLIVPVTIDTPDIFRFLPGDFNLALLSNE